jgi:hypothetical protein
MAVTIFIGLPPVIEKTKTIKALQAIGHNPFSFYKTATYIYIETDLKKNARIWRIK